MHIILASNSPRRRELLGNMGLGSFDIVSPDIEEFVEGNPAPAQLVMALSAQKAAAVAFKSSPGALVIAADTVVVLDETVLGKPIDTADAVSMLTALSGRRHQVYSGVTVRQDETVLTEHEVTTVSFRALTAAEILDYIATGEPMDKAGAYGIQRYGALLVEGVTGDYFNVMGLPVNRLRAMLARFGLDCLKLASAAKEKTF
ncbi:MAG: septum formation protein Maf [Clostridia bacterium]|nr:septum formation protein Maf [Clostridia bacterium]